MVWMAPDPDPTVLGREIEIEVKFEVGSEVDVDVLLPNVLGVVVLLVPATTVDVLPETGVREVGVSSVVLMLLVDPHEVEILAPRPPPTSERMGSVPPPPPPPSPPSPPRGGGCC